MNSTSTKKDPQTVDVKGKPKGHLFYLLRKALKNKGMQIIVPLIYVE
jgi:hypothetical protein